LRKENTQNETSTEGTGMKEAKGRRGKKRK
jgi:hypothetical protein